MCKRMTSELRMQAQGRHRSNADDRRDGHQLALQTDLETIQQYDKMILRLEGQLIKSTRRVASRDYALLRTVTGIGQALALTLLYEIQDIARFSTRQRFCSYCRLVKGTVASAGKIKGLLGSKLGNPYLRWAFGEAAVLSKGHSPFIQAYAPARKEEAVAGRYYCNAPHYFVG